MKRRTKKKDGTLRNGTIRNKKYLRRKDERKRRKKKQTKMSNKKKHMMNGKRFEDCGERLNQKEAERREEVKNIEK